MELANPFPDNVRNLYLGDWRCRNCGGNGQEKGGLALHHILGRVSGSVFNSCLLCGDCHSKIGHTQEEEQKYFAITFQWCYNKGYNPSEDDFAFIRKYYNRVFTPALEKWLQNLNLRRKSL